MQVVEVLTYRFIDSVAATLHFADAGVLSCANGLVATVAVANLSAALDRGVVAVNDTVTVTDSNVATSAPTILSTTNVQNVGSPTIIEPVKDFFKSGDVVTFTIRDANGS